MTRILKNNILAVEIAEPMELYQASRFDHSGNILQVTLNGKHTFLTTEKGILSPNHGFGLMNEFDIDNPCDYNETKIGDPFHKIGVGSLIKDKNSSYDFFNQYQKSPWKFDIELINMEKIFYSAVSPLLNEIQLEYHKMISIEGNQLLIEYRLKNEGKRAITTCEYCHNFISLNHQPVGSNYKLTFNFDLQTKHFKTIVDNADLLSFTNNQLNWKTTPENEFFIAGINGNLEIAKWWQIINIDEGIGIREQIDFECKQVNLWGTTHVVSPELFHQIHLTPDEAISWSRRYTFFEL